MIYDYKPECLTCPHRAELWDGRDHQEPWMDKCDLDDRIEILVYWDHVETPPGCPLVLAAVNEAAERRIDQQRPTEGWR